MKNFNFKLEGFKAISTNSATQKSKYSVSKSPSYRIFEAEFENYMDFNYPTKVKELKELFDENKHCIALEFKFYYPCETKSGRLHRRAGDTSNGIKSTEDALFSYLDIDDSFVTQVSAMKLHSKNERIVIDIWVKDYVRV